MRSGEMLDAGVFLAFAERLRRLKDRLDDGGLSDGQRGRLQARLVTVTQAAAADLERADADLDDLESEVARLLG